MWWMKHVPNGREERKTARCWDPRTDEEHSQQQVDKYEVLLNLVKSVRVTQCDRAADIPEGVPSCGDAQAEKSRT